MAHDVTYEFEVVGVLPEKEFRSSQLEEAVQKVKDTVAHGEAVVIASYANRTAASAAANVLRKRHGPPEAHGFKFECHRIEDRSKLFVVYNPAWATPEGATLHQKMRQAEKERLSKTAAARREKKNAERAAKGETAPPRGRPPAKS
jgi:hypothetical protein